MTPSDLIGLKSRGIKNIRNVNNVGCGNPCNVDAEHCSQGNDFVKVKFSIAGVLEDYESTGKHEEVDQTRDYEPGWCSHNPSEKPNSLKELVERKKPVDLTEDAVDVS